jgi:cob(I)alamin adenosyltransferase
MKKYFSGEGDEGSTGLLGESRVPKSHIRIQAVGAIDEASATLGLARAMVDDHELNQIIQSILKDLYQIMSLIVLESPDPEKFPDLDPERVAWLEESIQHYQEKVPETREFIMPGDTKLSAVFGIARTIVRRAERNIVELDQAGFLLSETALAYLNRLSSLCFVLEMYTSENLTPIAKKS